MHRRSLISPIWRLGFALALALTFIPPALSETAGDSPTNRALFDKLAERAGPILAQIDDDMVKVPAGSFQTAPDGGASSQRIEMPAFELSRHEVTQAQWRALMVKNPSHFDDCDACPVENVSWNDVQAFISRLNGVTGGNYRLPSESEWEYACRAGSDQAYCGGDDLDPLAWYANNSYGRTQRVGQKQANDNGLHDMSGNVMEWLQDCWDPDAAGLPEDGSAVTVDDCIKHATRGGHWGVNAWFLRAAAHDWRYTNGKADFIGFRLAR